MSGLVAQPLSAHTPLTAQSQNCDSLLTDFHPSAVWIYRSLQTNFQVEWKTRQRRERTVPDDLLLFQKRLEARIQLFQELKEMESVAVNQVIFINAKSIFTCRSSKSVARQQKCPNIMKCD